MARRRSRRSKRSKRRSSNGNSYGSFLLQAFVTVTVLLVLFGSLLTFIFWLIFERKNSRLPKVRSITAFDHTDRETSKINALRASLSRHYNRLDQIEKDGADLRKRNDGLFNEQSQRGRRFNLEIQRISPEIDEQESSLSYYEDLPNQRLKKWLFDRSMVLSFRISILIYIASFAAFYVLEPTWMLQLSTMMQKYSLLDFYSAYPTLYGTSVGSFVLSSLGLLSYYFFKDDLKGKLHNHFEEKEEERPKYTLEDILQSLSHVQLKELVDTCNITANKRSKSNIIQAILEQQPEKQDEVIGTLRIMLS
ncbi:hypothetical protein C0W35_09770 [Photobacterium kishitanii]|uniref:hypothetical protein n=1 Tax=Photobacterium kishitanii TaxID=318456 RepID=UPI000D155D0D|nr:hypothetical protein [Photobacterium kishitanii]PSU93980.1 hypothetical protein C0W35_09770 [Photobacterium kishitanii]